MICEKERNKIIKFSFIFVLFLFFVKFSSGLSVTVHVPEKYVYVTSGERFYFEVEIRHPESEGREDLKISYEIVNEKGDSIAKSKVLKSVETQASFIDFIVIPESTKKGIHFIKVGVENQDKLDKEVEVSFNVRKELGFEIYFFILLGLIILFIIIFVSFMFFVKKK